MEYEMKYQMFIEMIIRNIRAYLLTTLYNAPVTMDNYYTAQVNHDFHGRW